MTGGRSRRWANLRRYMIMLAKLSPEPTYCPRCNLPITDPDSADLGHVTDAAIADPSQPVHVRLEHVHCNRSAGWALAREMRRRPRHKITAWESTEL